MKWQFDGEGGWEAYSKLTDGPGVPFVYRIHVCDDGSFTLDDTDKELTEKRDTFPTLDAAKAFCAGNERDIEAEKAT